MMGIDKLVVGTEDYHGEMRRVGIEGLRRKAGFVAGKGEFDEEVKGDCIFYERVQRDDWFENLVRFVKGFGWVAGGSALAAVHGWKIGYGDVDVFCHSREDYKVLCDEFRFQSWREKDRSRVIENVRFGFDGRAWWSCPCDVNLLCPGEGDNWEHPAGVLQGFEGITTPGVVVVEPGLGYSLWRDDVIGRIMNYTGNCRNAAKMMRRIIKYQMRGCTFGENFWTDLLGDPRTRQIPYLARDIHELGGVNGTGQYLSAVWDVREYEGDYDKSSLDEDGFDEWY